MVLWPGDGFGFPLFVVVEDLCDDAVDGELVVVGEDVRVLELDGDGRSPDTIEYWLGIA